MASWRARHSALTHHDLLALANPRSALFLLAPSASVDVEQLGRARRLSLAGESDSRVPGERNESGMMRQRDEAGQSCC